MKLKIIVKSNDQENTALENKSTNLTECSNSASNLWISPKNVLSLESYLSLILYIYCIMTKQ